MCRKSRSSQRHSSFQRFLPVATSTTYGGRQSGGTLADGALAVERGGPACGAGARALAVAAGLTAVKPTGRSGEGGGSLGWDAMAGATMLARGAVMELARAAARIRRPSIPPATPSATMPRTAAVANGHKVLLACKRAGGFEGPWVTATGPVVRGAPSGVARPEIDGRSKSDVAVCRANAATSNGGGVVGRSLSEPGLAASVSSGLGGSARCASDGGYLREVMIDACGVARVRLRTTIA
jgi:hypothetical protein